ncbi:MAG: glycosyltransferase family 2 protein [Acidithiobacillus sp.]|nr:glycosyltransferase family 2 protein [Acidithiobacillus sp.]
MSQLLSVVIVNYHSLTMLKDCIPSVLRQELPEAWDLEVLLVDNSPGDGTAQWVADHFPEVHIISSPTNDGYAGGNNRGITAARGDYVLVLNPDVVVVDGALKAMLDATAVDPQGFYTAKLLRQDGLVNACGCEMHWTGITVCHGLGQEASDFNGVIPVSLLSGAAILAKRSLWLNLRGFDPKFFLYMEDADLSLRAKKAGFRLWCAADALILHQYSLKMTSTKFYYLERNRLVTLLKNLSGCTLRRMAIGLLLTELATWVYALLRGPEYLLARWRGYLWLWHYRQVLWAERQRLSQGWVIPDEFLLQDMHVKLPYYQLVRNDFLARLLSGITTPLYQWTRPGRGSV